MRFKDIKTGDYFFDHYDGSISIAEKPSPDGKTYWFYNFNDGEFETVSELHYRTTMEPIFMPRVLDELFYGGTLER